MSGFNFQTSAVQKAHEARRAGFGQAKAMEEHDLGNILGGLAAIGEDMKQHYPRISESLFKGRYLDAFAGFGESLEDNYALYLEWMQTVAKQYNIPVHVCDDRDNSIILFTVPAISNVQTINPQKARNEEIQAAISAATDARYLQPYNWEAMLSNNLVGIFQKVYDKANAVTGVQKEWFDIFERYKDHFKGRKQLGGFEQQLMVGNDGNTAQSQANNNRPAKPAVPTNTTFVEVEEDV
jgi:hypothetical protein